jgi:hypothetical protein
MRKSHNPPKRETNFTSEWCRCGDSDNRNKPPFDKGRFGGNVNINGGVLDTTTILKATKVSFWETFVII